VCGRFVSVCCRSYILVCLLIICSYSFSLLRYQLGLIVPQNNTNEDCFLRIRPDIEKNHTMVLRDREALLDEGTKYFWHEGEGVMFDDNHLHDSTSNSDDIRVVLFLDVPRKMPFLMDIVNRMAIYVATRQTRIIAMRNRAVLDETKELIKAEDFPHL
jgi:hypothetical protein